MKRTLLASFAAAAILAGGAAIPGQAAWAQSKQGIKLGTLTCNVSSGWGVVFGSTKDLRCTYTPDGRKKSERYSGRIDKFGIDIGYTEAGVIVWVVFAPTKNVDAGALAGKYVGATAEVTIAVGLGANVLVGGSEKSIALQPLSVSGQKGLNIAAGIASVELRSAN
jgi:hypothetical protein